MFHQTAIEVKKDVAGTLIPSGVKIELRAGTQVMVTQALGNSYTVYVNGNLVRVAGRDGDALGLVVLEELDINEQPGSLEDKIWAQLRTCFDPEIPVNIVDLGLIYTCDILPLGKDEFNVNLRMTLTAAGCGMGPILVSEIIEKLQQIHCVKKAEVELVFDPPWDKDKMSDEAKLQLGLL